MAVCIYCGDKVKPEEQAKDVLLVCHTKCVAWQRHLNYISKQKPKKKRRQ